MLTRGVLILLASVLLCGCLKPRDTGPTKIVDRLIPAELKAYWDFQPGSYWVYQDSATGALDTVTVVDRQQVIFDSELSYDPNVKGICELFNLKLETSGGLTYYYGINTAFGNDVLPYYMTGNLTRVGGSSAYASGRCFVYPLIVGNATYDPYPHRIDTISIQAIHDSAFGFNDVVQINQTYNQVEGEQYTRWFWAKNVGIVRKVWIDSARVESMIDYHVVQ